MPEETMRMYDDPSIVLETTKAAINLATKIQVFSNSLATIAAAVSLLVTEARVKSTSADDWEAR